MKGLDYLRMSFGNVDAKLPPLKEVKPQHPLGKFSDYEDALDELWQSLRQSSGKSFSGVAAVTLEAGKR